MKKLLVFSVIFALIAGMAFAQLEAGGRLTSTLVGIDTEKPGQDKLHNADTYYGLWLNFGKFTDDGTAAFKFGTWFDSGDKIDRNGMAAWAYAWWRPIPQLFLKIGKIGEQGMYWAGSDYTAWGIHANDACDFVSPSFEYYNGYAGGILASGHGYFGSGINDNAGSNGFQMTILPIDGLAVNLGFNFASESYWPTHEFVAEPEIGDQIINTLAAQIVYDLGIGKAALGFNGFGKGQDIQIAAQWQMGVGDGMNVEIGVKTFIKDNGDTAPIDIGIGFGMGQRWSGETFMGDVFQLRARLGVSIALEDTDVTRIGLDIVPSYDLGNSLRAYALVGFGVGLPKGGDTAIAWVINPYIVKGFGGVNLWAGIQLYNGQGNGAGAGIGQFAGTAGDNIHFSIPFGFQFSL